MTGPVQAMVWRKSNRVLIQVAVPPGDKHRFLTSVLQICLSIFFATAPAATLPMVSRAEDRPPPATARMPYFMS